MFDAIRVRTDFPIFEQTVNGHPLIYLDSTASAQKPRRVIEAVADVYQRYYANVHRGIYPIAEEATLAYEAARQKVASFIGAEPEEIVFVRNTTEAINLVMYAWGLHTLRPGDRIVITEMEHHSNMVPWQELARWKEAELVYAPVTDAGELDLEAMEALIKGGRTRLVAFTAMSNVLGTITPARELVAMAHAAGALALVDGAQSVPHLPVDVRALGADFLAFSGHKLGAPGIGALYARRDVLEHMAPFLYGGEMILRVTKAGATWNDLPHKFEAGTPAIAEAVGLGVAVDYLRELGMDAVHAHEQALTQYAMACLSEVPGLRILGPSAERRGGVVAFTLEGAHPHDIADILGGLGICIRAGLHCAEPLHMRFGLPATARASFYVYNLPSDIDALIAGLHEVRRVMGLTR